MRSSPLLVLGLMSGTSADAIDIALARISGTPPHLNSKLLNHTSINFPHALRKEILRVAEQQPISDHDLHATILQLLGIDHKKLTYRFNGRDMRLTDVYGVPIPQIIA